MRNCLFKILTDRANGDVIDPGVDKSSHAVDAMFDWPAGGPDFHALAGKVLLIIRVEKSFGFAKRLLSITVHGSAVVQNGFEFVRVSLLLDQQFPQSTQVVLKHCEFDLVGHPTVRVASDSP